MAKNAMGIKNFVKLAKVLPAETSVLLRANHGVGKSQITAQVADWIREKEFSEEMAANPDADTYPLIDMRLGQITEGDIIGLPMVTGGITNFAPPWWVRKACEEPVHLFLDEINRATTEVMQAAFQLVLDRRLQNNILHPQTRVYAAVNTGAAYTVNEMDPALLDRFWAIDLTPTVDEWVEWAKNEPTMMPVMVDFIRKHYKHLDPPDDIEAGAVSASRRSWARLSKTLIHANVHETPDNQIFYQLALGFVGAEATIAFSDFAKNWDAQISGKDIIEKLVKKFQKKDPNPEDVSIIGTDKDTNTYDKRLAEILENLSQSRMNAMNESVADYILKTYASKGLGSKQGTALAKYMYTLPAELRVSLWSLLIKNGVEDMALSQTIHRWSCAIVMNSFGVKMGKSGVGMVPTIPDAFKDKS